MDNRRNIAEADRLIEEKLAKIRASIEEPVLSPWRLFVHNLLGMLKIIGLVALPIAAEFGILWYFDHIHHFFIGWALIFVLALLGVAVWTTWMDLRIRKRFGR